MKHGFNPYAADGVQPCDGWALRAVPEFDGDGFYATGFEAVRGDEVRSLNVSRFDFEATQARFDWLVRHGFPGGPMGSWTDKQLDAAMAASTVARAA